MGDKEGITDRLKEMKKKSADKDIEEKIDKNSINLGNKDTKKTKTYSISEYHINKMKLINMMNNDNFSTIIEKGIDLLYEEINQKEG